MMSSKWPTKRILAWILIPAVLVTGILVWQGQLETQPSNLKFSARGCKMKALDEGASALLKSIGKTWKNENTLLVNAHVAVNCAFEVKSGDYKTEGKALTLKYRTHNPSPGMAAACNCLHEVSYEITNLKKDDYEIRLLEK